MDRFIAKENIKHFVDRLQTEEDGLTRVTLQKLLIAEEDKFAQLSERLDMVEQNIVRISDLAVLQRARVNDIRAGQNGHDANLAHQHLSNLEKLYDTFVAYQRLVVKELDRQEF